jgi:hypothetical protein
MARLDNGWMVWYNVLGEHNKNYRHLTSWSRCGKMLLVKKYIIAKITKCGGGT